MPSIIGLVVRPSLLAATGGLSSDAPDWGIRAGLEFGFEIPYLAGPKD